MDPSRVISGDLLIAQSSRADKAAMVEGRTGKGHVTERRHAYFCLEVSKLDPRSLGESSASRGEYQYLLGRFVRVLLPVAACHAMIMREAPHSTTALGNNSSSTRGGSSGKPIIATVVGSGYQAGV